MITDDETLRKLLRINDELLQICKLLNKRKELVIASRLVPLTDELHAHSDRNWRQRSALNDGRTRWKRIGDI